MGNHFAYTINGPIPDAMELPSRLPKSLSVRREPKIGGNHLRDMYQNPVQTANRQASISSTEHSGRVSGTPQLPPTPPNLDEVEDSDGEFSNEITNTAEMIKARSILTTPVNQASPPTPDNTPPRERPKFLPFLGNQPSTTSTRAESFKTAREDIPSDEESVLSMTFSQHTVDRSLPRLILHSANGAHKPSPLVNEPLTSIELVSTDSTLMGAFPLGEPFKVHDHENSHQDMINENHDIPYVSSQHEEIERESFPKLATPADPSHRRQLSPTQARSQMEGMQRGRSLRERVAESRKASHSPAMDKFASIIGWNNDVHTSSNSDRRWSAASKTSTVEALLVENPRMIKKRNTLRHVSKNDSLRSVSSPLPTSNRTSLQSSSDSPHRLVHKKGKLSNRNRMSFGSEMSQSASANSNLTPKVEVIRVAIIPERSSSLQRSTISSRRQSVSNNGAPTSFRMTRQSDVPQKRRVSADEPDRGRDRHYPPQVPQRGSSLSAPTSRNTSRANSITSDHAIVERKRAEKDLRTTLDKMESDRMVSSLRSGSHDKEPAEQDLIENRKESSTTEEIRIYHPDVQAHDFATGFDPYLMTAEPGTREWAELRPSFSLHTPFSQPSFLSASPEISEAKLISLHPHNNHSVQLIEPYPLHESSAVEEARKLNQAEYDDYETLDSPLRNPRRAPPTPQFQVPPVTPQHQTMVTFSPTQQYIVEPTTPSRPQGRGRTDSFVKGVFRTISLKEPRNKKADQVLDSKEHPFWRPRPFWDGIEGASPEKKREAEVGERGIINNSLGLPQQRTVIAGPLSLVRKLSQRGGRKSRFLTKQSSYNSLQRIRTGHKLYQLPGFGVNFHMLSLREIHERVVMIRQRKEDERREKKREALRKSIGTNIIATGDSRFPVTMADDETAR